MGTYIYPFFYILHCMQDSNARGLGKANTDNLKCPICDEKLNIGQTRCPQCGGSIPQQSLAQATTTQKSTKPVKKTRAPSRDSTTHAPIKRQSAPVKKSAKQPKKKKEGYWDKLDRPEIRRIRNYIFSIEIILIVIIMLNAMYESILIDPFYLPMGYLLLFILLLVFLISVEGLWFKYIFIKKSRSFKKRVKLIKDYRNTAQSAFVTAIVILIILLSLNFLPFINDMLRTDESVKFSNLETEKSTNFEDQDLFGLTQTNNLDLDSNNTVGLKLHVRELSKDDSNNIREKELGNQSDLEYQLDSPDFQLGYAGKKEYHFFILNVGNTNVSCKYSINREISKPFIFNILLFMIFFIITSIIWLAYLGVIRKRYEKLHEEKVTEVMKRYAVKPYTIEDVFLIYRDGTLINHQTRRIKPMDNDILSGMLTAIKDFIRDVFKVDSTGELNELKYGAMKIMIETGEFAFLAVVVSGTPPKDLRPRMKRAISHINKQFYNELKSYSGNVRRLSPTKSIVQQYLWQQEDKKTHMDSNSDSAWNNKGVILTKLGKYNEALDCFDNALKLNPGVSNTWLNRGIALVKLNEFQEAMDCFDRALQLDPNNEVATRRRNKCWYKWKLMEGREHKVLGDSRRRAGAGVSTRGPAYDYEPGPAPRPEYGGGTMARGGAGADYYDEPSYKAAPADEPPPRCPRCGQPLEFVDEFESWYCSPCDSYPFDD